MYRIGQSELSALSRIFKTQKLFRYGDDTQCDRFERRYARYLSVKHVCMAPSGTHALTAALVGLGIGPGDEVLIPSHTYMATAVSVLAAGAIPVVVDIDESITLDPDAFESAIGRRVRAVIPVHMWGLPCDMGRILRIARKHKVLVVEDACQGVGGGYEGCKLGSMGHAGAFSFNYYKNMSCGEGGAVVSSDAKVFERARCSIDCCRAFWNDQSPDFVPFTFNGSRASEIEGAIMNAQLDRIDPMIRAMRSQKKRILKAATKAGLTPSPLHSPDHECASQNHFCLPTAAQAEAFAKLAGGTVCGNTGRHTYTEWAPLLNQQGAHHPALNPYLLPQNKPCRRKLTADMFPRSLEILARTVMIGNHPDRTAPQVQGLIEKITSAARSVLGPPNGARRSAPRRAHAGALAG